MVEPTLNVLEACHRLALSEGQKRELREDEKVRSETEKVIARTLEVIGVLFLIIDAALLNMPEKDLALTGFLTIVGSLMFITGLILSHLPPETEKKEEKERCKSDLCSQSF